MAGTVVRMLEPQLWFLSVPVLLQRLKRRIPGLGTAHDRLVRAHGRRLASSWNVPGGGPAALREACGNVRVHWPRNGNGEEQVRHVDKVSWRGDRLRGHASPDRRATTLGTRLLL